MARFGVNWMKEGFRGSAGGRVGPCSGAAAGGDGCDIVGPVPLQMKDIEKGVK